MVARILRKAFRTAAAFARFSKHSARFGFMRDCVGSKFHNYRVADLFRRPDRFLFVQRHPGFYDGDAVRFQDPFGFEFVEESPAGCARA